MATNTRYEALAADFEQSIRSGVLKTGERMPSIRQAARARRLGISTVRRAYVVLESQGLIDGKPRAGYYVRRPSDVPSAGRLAPSQPPLEARTVDVSRMVLASLKAIRSRRCVPLGSPYPDPALFPWRRIQQHGNEIAKRFTAWNVVDDIPPGHPEMMRQIARRHLETGLAANPDEVIVTVGATEAINLCLQAVAKPGDTVAIESPTYYAMLHSIERMGMRAVEVATDPESGLDVDALRRLLQRQRIDACLVMPNFQNPLGFTMPDEHKRRLVELAGEHDLPIVENGVYNELFFGDRPPSTLKSFDTRGLVLFCGSFSKSLTAGVRIGWALPGRYRDDVEKLKFLNTLATPAIPQLAISQYLVKDGWDRHLRTVRQTLSQRLRIMSSAVGRLFPEGTVVSRPAGGYLLWAQLPEGIDTMRVHQEALEAGITVAPGRIFSNADLYPRCLRLNFSYPWTAQVEDAMRQISRIASGARVSAARRP
jgi:DNA-binding transcriptional MocR family regulator